MSSTSFRPSATGDFPSEFSLSAISWPAIIGGAFAAAAVSLMLLFLGTGIGLASVSPWGNSDSPAEFTLKAAIWLIVMQWIASGLGGYLTGRLRTRWTNVHTHEICFRDTTHGFLAWSVATIMTAALVACLTFSAIGTGAQIATHVALSAAAAGAAGAASNDKDGEHGYFVDSLFRTERPDAPAFTGNSQAETGRILATVLTKEGISAEDKAYLSRRVAAHTGLSPEEANKRVDVIIAQVKAAEEKARELTEATRKAAKKMAFFTFFSLLIGAFIASAAAALGGRQRDAC